jgi:ketosteroid isomerase-like protein
MTRDHLAAWVAAYERAWRTAGTDALAELFTDDAVYRQSPYAEPVVGLEAIAEMWDATRSGPDERFRMHARTVAVEGDVGVVRVDVRYEDPVREYRDLWVVRLADSRRASSFEEWPFFPGRPLTSSPGS